MLDLTKLNEIIKGKYEGINFTIDSNSINKIYKVETNILSSKKKPISAWVSNKNSILLEKEVRRAELTGNVDECIIVKIITESLPFPYGNVFAERVHNITGYSKSIEDINEVVKKRFRGFQFIKDYTKSVYKLETDIYTKNLRRLFGVVSKKNTSLIDEMLSSSNPIDEVVIMDIIKESLPEPYSTNLSDYVTIDINEDAFNKLKETFDNTIVDIENIYTKLSSMLNDKNVERYLYIYSSPYKFNKEGIKPKKVLLEDKYSIENDYCKCICSNPNDKYIIDIEFKDENISYLKEAYEYFNNNIDFIKKVGEFKPKEEKLKKEYFKKLVTYCSASDADTYLFNRINVDDKKIIIGNIPHDIDSNTLEKLEKHYNELLEKYKEEYDIKLKDAKNALSGVDDYYILNLINTCKDKGMTTYIDILKGSKRSKLIENDYDKLDEYSKLSMYKKDEIESKIFNLIHKKYLMRVDKRGSRGYYYEALCLTSLSEDILKRFRIQDFNNEEKTYIECLEFLTEAQKYESFIAISDYYNIIPLKQDSDIFEIIKYIKECKKNYKNDIDVLVQLLGKAIDSKFRPLIELNALSESGIAKDTLLNLAKVMG